ncbi:MULTISPECIES: GNAT family N-acetyltransferase [Paenibacillus]|uniref:GNAT family N-acetyltransferase n=1 Tax=Paenibacillus TaxID=44249 RepID=UPI00203FC33C|nr:GNAT family N-acetyltransferase [Paenibacillus camelliae]MCM3633266.1 GNAT family N-acetyltransferase [Paenibacillus camelliae]
MLRSATANDAHAVVELIILAIGSELTELYTGFSSPQKAAPILLQYYLQPGNRFSKELIVVYEQADQIQGMILCYVGEEAAARYAPIERQRSSELKKTVNHPIEAELDEYYIDALAVHPSFQGKGIASKLMKQAELDAALLGKSKVGLLVDQDKEHAYQIYEKKGYRKVNEKMLGNQPFWHMVKEVSIM